MTISAGDVAGADVPSTAPARAESARPWWRRADGSARELSQIEDSAIDALSDDGRRTLAAIWQERGASELRVAGGFAAIVEQLIVHGTAESVLQIVSRAVRDEVRHAEISVELAARYRASSVEWPPSQSVPVPELKELKPSDGRLRATLLVVAMCCINETLACGILEKQLSQTRSVLARAAQQSVLSDEIDHARAGWAHLASPHVTAAMKHEIGRWLPRLFNARLRELLDEDRPFQGEQFPEHGILTRQARKQVVASMLHEVVLSGFARTGINPAHGSEWARTAFG